MLKFNRELRVEGATWRSATRSAAIYTLPWHFQANCRGGATYQMVTLGCRFARRADAAGSPNPSARWRST